MDVRIDWLVRLEVEGNFLFLAFIRQDRADEQHQTVRGHPVVQLETLLGRGDGSEHGETVNPGLDVGGRSILLRQHGGDPGNLILQPKVSDRIAILARLMHLGRDDERDHGSTRSGTCDEQGRIRGRVDGTYPLAASRLLMSFLTFHIWMFCSAGS